MFYLTFTSLLTKKFFFYTHINVVCKINLAERWLYAVAQLIFS